MTIRVALQHHTKYSYEKPITLFPHLIRLRPAAHCRTPIHSYSLTVKPAGHFVNWQQDPYGNFVARFVFPEKVRSFEVNVEVIADMTVINPFDFFLEPYAEKFPFTYEEKLAAQLHPYLQKIPAGEKFAALIKEIDLTPLNSTHFLVNLNRHIHQLVAYNIRMEPGVQSPEETLQKASGSCRDSAWLLVAVARQLGLAARFVSGYLVQLAADIKALDGPSGTATDFTDLHAWAEIFIPGAGWIGLDPTSGLFAGEGHIPLACTPDPESAAPVTGATEKCEAEFEFSNTVTRIHEDPRVTKPYSSTQWSEINALGEQVENSLQKHDVRLTQGGEPTFVSIDDMDSAQWNTAALGEHKEKLARELLSRLRDIFAQGGLLHHGQGKWYPGEELPRWAYTAFFRKDGEKIWRDNRLLSPLKAPGYGRADAEKFARTLSSMLGIDSQYLQTAYEDAAHYLRYEASLPQDVDPRKIDLNSPLERRRFAAVLDQGLAQATGFALPLARHPLQKIWRSSPWQFKRGKLILVPGDSPMGYRLPLNALPVGKKPAPLNVQDNFAIHADLGSAEQLSARYISHTGLSDAQKRQQACAQNALHEDGEIVHTALCVQARGGRLWVFLPPLSHLSDWLDLISAIETCAQECNMAVELEGYEPPHDPRLQKLAVTPDPGVIEVNIHPADNWQNLITNTEALYEAARETRLGTEKFMLDGKHIGTCGGNHMTLGGATPADSPFLRRPDLLASLLLYWQHHPALSYLFSGVFIGPTSQAPRIDEARDDALYELEIALQQIAPGESTAPWLVDRIFRNLLVDITGNTHRAEFCIDKLYSPAGPTGRLGILEFRGFEMPPHWQMSAVQMLLIRALVAMFWQKPYRGRPAFWGTGLHDKFMLPYYIGQDIKQICADLNAAGFNFDEKWLAPFMEFRFPHFGDVQKFGMTMSIHGAIEPWNVLGEEVSSQGTSRYVDSSVERLQVKVSHFNTQRFAVLCNGRRVPLQATEIPGEYVAGVRFKAWQPVFGLHPRLKNDGPLVFDIVDISSGVSIAGCTYYVAHPSGRNYETLPVNANEAEARRIARFWQHSQCGYKLDLREEGPNPNFPCTLDLRYKR
ncbi:MAG: transglutaminase family protein [Oceanospirillaceae bacterium]|nr:transglutaminase family protein [Oceanospirillaceae bacterium]MCP5351122.1 transglutaminase family protein [Oceanospirillaceae bacterium]